MILSFLFGLGNLLTLKKSFNKTCNTTNNEKVLSLNKSNQNARAANNKILNEHFFTYLAHHFFPPLLTPQLPSHSAIPTTLTVAEEQMPDFSQVTGKENQLCSLNFTTI